jgi:hypothetical protein
MRLLAGWGLAGIFLGAMLANTVFLVNIPYMLLVLTVVLVDDSPSNLVLLSIASGAGAALGKMFAYAMASGMATRINTLPHSGLYAYMQRLVERHPRAVPIGVFLGAATFLPNDLFLMPLAAVNYPMRKALLPTLAGKIVHNLTLVTLFWAALGLGGGHVTQGVRVDLSLCILVISALIVAYQIEKARDAAPQPQRSDPAFPQRWPV